MTCATSRPQAAKGNARAQLALDVFVHQARHWIGSFFLQLNGADALVFTAGIGENQPAIRRAVCDDLDELGIVLDPEKNNATRRHRSDHQRPRLARKGYGHPHQRGTGRRARSKALP